MKARNIFGLRTHVESAGYAATSRGQPRLGVNHRSAGVSASMRAAGASCLVTTESLTSKMESLRPPTTPLATASVPLRTLEANDFMGSQKVRSRLLTFGSLPPHVAPRGLYQRNSC